MKPTQRTTAKVIATDIGEVRVWRGGQYGSWHQEEALLPTIRFEAEDGRVVQTQLTDPLPGGVEIGDEVAIVYDAQRAEVATLESAERDRRAKGWLFVGGCAMIPLFFVMSCILMVVLFLLLAAVGS